MAPDNKRYKKLDSDTVIGYNYLKKQYYITNKETNTYRDTAEEILEVLEALDLTITMEELLAFKSVMEELTELSYTWHDNGAYIHTIQLNSYSYYPLTIDCEKKKLYIMNTPIVYDLTVNESAKLVRVPRLCAFYRDKLGLHVSEPVMLILYNLLLSYYSPTCYNQIKQPENNTEVLYYNNKYILSNYNSKSTKTYTCTYNALQTNDTTQPIGYIEAIDNTLQTITTVVPIQDLQKGQSIYLHNTNTTIDNTPYTSDGIYTVTGIEDNLIYVKENIPVPYTFIHATCNLYTSITPIASINRENSTITLTSPVPDTIYIGDTIHVEGTTITTDYEEISCNGAYTVQGIEDNVITVSEVLPTNYTGTTGTIHKEIFLGNIKRIDSTTNTIYLLNNLPYTIQQGNTISVSIPDTDPLTNLYEVSVTSTDSITVTSTIPEYIPPYPTVNEVTPTPETLISVEGMEDFMVDNFDQSVKYIQTFKNLVVPTEENKNNLYSKVPVKYTFTTPLPIICEGSTEILYYISDMSMLGLYSEIYKEDQTWTNE